MHEALLFGDDEHKQNLPLLVSSKCGVLAPTWWLTSSNMCVSECVGWCVYRHVGAEELMA